jgi:hypothetical protein
LYTLNIRTPAECWVRRERTLPTEEINNSISIVRYYCTIDVLHQIITDIFSTCHF